MQLVQKYEPGFCKGSAWPSILHDYEVVREGERGIREKCVRCDYTLITRKCVDGSIDNMFYGKEHIRDFIQPHSRYYDREYGKGASKNFGNI